MSTRVRPVPAPHVPIAGPDGRITQAWLEYLVGRENVATDSSTSLDDLLADTILTVEGGKELTGGFTHAEYDNGTPTNGGSITPNPSNGLKQKVTNNVAGFTIAATAEIGDVELRVVNGSSAGTITFSGFEKNWLGDPLTTTNGHQFVVFIYGFNGKQAYLIKALQ